MVYRLSNGKILDEKWLFVAMIDDNIFNRYFLDIATGKVKLISEEFDIGPDKLLKPIKSKLGQRYFEIPKISRAKRYSWMKEFTEQMVDSEILFKKLKFILRKSRDFQFFEKVLYNDGSWVWGWVQWKVFELADELEDWLVEIDIDVKEECDYDDDCLLCQMMKKADADGKDPTLSETKAAFLKVKQQGGFVGGECFDKRHNLEK
ncbi:MAG: UPF0158 family protein [Candidatus Gribaldobacteria bacterium]|nr:UPF0158 family protein [Candidatus Gribaldobacteria bacterium]